MPVRFPEPRHASLRRLTAGNGDLIDDALLLRFAAPNTATGEPLVEFHLHGGRAVVARFLTELSTMPGLREAEPGEFTRRAMLNGRLDLTQAEGLADLLSAETEWQRRGAIESSGGALRRQVETWRDRLIGLSAQAEAAIDYVGDEDETGIDLRRLVRDAREIGEEWAGWLAKPPAELLQNGLRIVLAGPPNSGKSSLFNALLGKERAIVTPIAGTTRDLIEARLDLGGIPITLIDTAGLRDTDDEVESLGVALAEQAAREAEVVLWLGDPGEAPSNDKLVMVHSRADERGPPPDGSIAASVKASGGLADLSRVLRKTAALILPPPDQASLNRRQVAALRDASEALEHATDRDLLLTAESLRASLAALDRLSGKQSTDEVLDALFGRFCLGK